MDKIMDAQDKALSDALAALDMESGTRVQRPAPRPSEGYTARLTGPVTGYRVRIAGAIFNVEATSHGDAVIQALLTEGTPASFGAYVFMFDYECTDSTGLHFYGSDRYMRESLEAARIARQ